MDAPTVIASALAQHLRKDGRKGDSIVAHINPREAALLLRAGGSGTRNPKDGLREFFNPGGPGSSNSDGPDNSNGSPSGGQGPTGVSSGSPSSSGSNGMGSTNGSNGSMGFASPQVTGNYAPTGADFAPVNGGLVDDTGLTGRQYGIINAEQSLNPTMPSQGLAAMLGNMNYESGAKIGDLNPNAVNGIGAFGMAQDLSPNRQAAMMAALGVPSGTPTSQLGSDPLSRNYDPNAGALAGTMNAQLAANSADLTQNYPAVATQLQNPNSTLAQNVNAFGNGFEAPGRDAQGNVLGFSQRMADASNWNSAIGAAGPYAKADVSSDPFTKAVYAAVSKATAPSVNGMPGGLGYGDANSPAFATQPANSGAAVQAEFGQGISPTSGPQAPDAREIAIALGQVPADNNVGANQPVAAAVGYQPGFAAPAPGVQQGPTAVSPLVNRGSLDAPGVALMTGNQTYAMPGAAPSAAENLTFNPDAMNAAASNTSAFVAPGDNSIAAGLPPAQIQNSFVPSSVYGMANDMRQASLKPAPSSPAGETPSYGFDASGNRVVVGYVGSDGSYRPTSAQPGIQPGGTQDMAGSAASPAVQTAAQPVATPPPGSAPAAPGSARFLSQALKAAGPMELQGSQFLGAPTGLPGKILSAAAAHAGTYSPTTRGGNPVSAAQLAQLLVPSAPAAPAAPQFQLNPDGSIPISWPLSQVQAYYASLGQPTA